MPLKPALFLALALLATSGLAPTPPPVVAGAPAAAPAEAAAPVALADLFVAPAAAASTLPCFAFGICEACPDGTARPCLVVQCGTNRTESCGSCQPDCVPPPG